MTKHTQAPWNIMDLNNNPYIENNGYEICQFFRTAFLNDDYSEDIEFENAKANARLIAAAPELLEFAENMSSYLKDIIADKNHPINWRNECEILLNNCNQAITKSKGE